MEIDALVDPNIFNEIPSDPIEPAQIVESGSDASPVQFRSNGSVLMSAAFFRPV